MARPVSNAIKELRGTARADRQRSEPAPGERLTTIPPAPAHLGDSAKAEWTHLAALLVAAGTLTAADLRGLELLAEVLASASAFAAAVERDGTLIDSGSGAKKSHPALAALATARALAEYLRPLTVVGRLQGMRKVPFNVDLIVTDTGATASWVLSGQPVPASAAGFTPAIRLKDAKVATIVPVSKELIRSSKPAAESAIAVEIGGAIATALDRQFMDPTAAGVLDEVPAAIPFGAASANSSGSSITSIDADLAAMVATLVGAEMPLSTATWIMHPAAATALSMKRGTGGAPAYPLITARGGTLLGLPVLTSTACTTTGGMFIVLVEASEILIADEDEAQIDYSKHATLKLTTTPGDSTRPTSMWQSNLVAIMGTRWVNWLRRRTGAVAVLRNVAF